jgi:hypothetical protein
VWILSQKAWRKFGESQLGGVKSKEVQELISSDLFHPSLELFSYIWPHTQSFTCIPRMPSPRFTQHFSHTVLLPRRATIETPNGSRRMQASGGFPLARKSPRHLGAGVAAQSASFIRRRYRIRPISGTVSSGNAAPLRRGVLTQLPVLPGHECAAFIVLISS